MLIRRLRDHELSAFASAWPGGAGPWGPDALRRYQPNVWGLLYAGRWVGGLVGHDLPDGGEVLQLWVSPGHRRRGWAGHLLRAFVASQAPRGVLLEVAHDNTGALALYERFGFQRIGRRKRYYPSGADAIVMRLDSSGPAAPV